MTCPDFDLISRLRGHVGFDGLLDAAQRAALEAHVGGCSRCSKELRLLEAQKDAASALRPEASDDLSLRRAETELVARAREPLEPRRWGSGRVAMVATAAAFAMILAVLGRASLEEEPGALRLGHVEAEHGVRMALDAEGPQEWVRLSSGRILVEVQHLEPGQRFGVSTTDAEVEVRGTRFEVEAERGMLRAVRVEEGRVEVRWQDEAPVLLVPGERWSLEGLNPAAERAFRTAFADLEDGRAREAAKGFARASGLAPAGAASEDARYWRGVALARAGLRQPAVEAFGRYLSLHGEAPRAPEVHVFLGKLLLDGGRVRAAAEHFEVALTLGDAELRPKAEVGLQEARRREARREPGDF